MFREMASDFKFAFRVLRRAPLFTVVSVVIIALGVGAVTTAFSAMESLLLRPVAGTRDAERVMGFELLAADGDFTMTASPDLIELWQKRARLIDGVAGHTRNELTLTIAGTGIAAEGGVVTASFLQLLNVAPSVGRLFSPADDSTGAVPVAVLSHDFWTLHFGANPGVVGSVVAINGHATTIVGVAGADFVGAMSIIPQDLWITRAAAQQLLPDRRSWLRPIAALKEGVSADAAARELSALLAQRVLEPDSLPDGIKRTIVRLSPLRAIPADARGDFMSFLGLLLAGSALVLIIASVNVGTMLSARSIARQREMALRAALGAGRFRLIRQLMAESVLLYVSGGVIGAALAVFLTGAVEQIRVPIDVNLRLEISPNPTVFLFALTAALLTGLIFGLGPAVAASRTDISRRLRDESAGGGRKRSRGTSVLIVGQLAASLVLLVCAALFTRALDRGRRMDKGFDATNVATMQLRSSQWGYSDERMKAFQADFQQRASALPGVEEVSYAAQLPLTASSEGGRFIITGQSQTMRADGTPAGVQLSVAKVGPSYFRLLRMPLRSGRSIAESDGQAAPRVAVINETMAQRFWPAGDAVGRTFMFRDSLHTVVGVVRDAQYQSLNDAIPSVVYVPLLQHWQPDQMLLVRGSGDVVRTARAMSDLLALMDPMLPRPPVIPLQRANGIVLVPQQIAAVATGLMGLVGLVLAVVGLYGIVSYSAGRRTREIGVRMAIGASERAVLRLMVGEGLSLTLYGVIAGAVLSVGAARLASSFLLNAGPFDATSFVAVPAFFACVAAFASYIPARRAASQDPLIALQAE